MHTSLWVHTTLSESWVLSAPHAQEQHVRCPATSRDTGQGEERSEERLRQLVLTSQESKSFEVHLWFSFYLLFLLAYVTLSIGQLGMETTCQLKIEELCPVSSPTLCPATLSIRAAVPSPFKPRTRGIFTSSVIFILFMPFTARPNFLSSHAPPLGLSHLFLMPVGNKPVPDTS